MLQAALELLAEVDFEAMSIEAIVSGAGVGKTTIYRHNKRHHALCHNFLANF
jgi:AcrR family transcriptional regulator